MDLYTDEKGNRYIAAQHSVTGEAMGYYPVTPGGKVIGGVGCLGEKDIPGLKKWIPEAERKSVDMRIWDMNHGPSVQYIGDLVGHSIGKMQDLTMDMLEQMQLMDAHVARCRSALDEAEKNRIFTQGGIEALLAVHRVSFEADEICFVAGDTMYRIHQDPADGRIAYQMINPVTVRK